MRCIFKKYMFKIIRVNNLKYFVISFRSVFFYIIVVCVYKIMGKREIGELSVIDLIVSLFIAELVAISIENYKESLFISLIPIIILVFLQCITSRISLKNKKVRDVIDGKPSVIINRGKINFKEMLKQRYNIDDLLSQLRSQSIKSIEEVDYANSLGLETIITDHHEQAEKLPKALAVVDAKRKDNKYPFDQLAGVGVVFKLAQAIRNEIKLR